MDVSKYLKEKNNWIFDDTFPKKVLGTFIKAKEWKTNGGKDVDVFVLSIESTTYLIMPFKVDYVSFVENYGVNTESWNDKPFYMSKDKKGKYILNVVEEEI